MDSRQRRISKRKSIVATSSSAQSTPVSSRRESETDMGKSFKKCKKKKERWLLTRKTWRYMADAGRKLIPDGAFNRPEDIPKIEAYFNEVCQKEPKFLLWRKSSYPGAFSFRHPRRRNRLPIKGGSCRLKSESVDELGDVARRKEIFMAQHTSGGRFDIQKLKYDFLNPKPSGSKPIVPKKSPPKVPEGETETNELIEMLEKYLSLSQQEELYGSLKSNLNNEHQMLLSKLNAYGDCLQNVTSSLSSKVRLDARSPLGQTLGSYLKSSTQTERLISNLLNDPSSLRRFYADLRKTKEVYRRKRIDQIHGHNPTTPDWRLSLHHYDDVKHRSDHSDQFGSNYNLWSYLEKPINYDGIKYEPSTSPPPIIAIQSDSLDLPNQISNGIQTDALSAEEINELEVEYARKQIPESREEISPPPRVHTPRRKSSIDNDDVSQSVSDTIKRYLKMARKKSVDTDKVDRFKRVNYDKNLRFITAKGEITKISDDDGNDKGTQTNDDWITTYKEEVPDNLSQSLNQDCQSVQSLQSLNPNDIKSPPSSPSSPASLFASGQSFLSNLFTHKSHDKNLNSAAGGTFTSAGGMQKSKSSSSVVQQGKNLVTKKIWKSRSKSQTRARPSPLTWMPQGQNSWVNIAGCQVVLQDTPLLQLSAIERKILQKVAIAKLQAINLGVNVKVPSETSSAIPEKPKRRAYLLKKKAITTSFFDSKTKDSDTAKSGLVFGVPLNKCIENERGTKTSRSSSPSRARASAECSEDESAVDLRRKSHHGSRISCESLTDGAHRTDEDNASEYLLKNRITSSIPGMLDGLSQSTNDLASSEESPEIPYMVSACIKYLEQYGLNTLGIFRVSSSKKRVRQLREDFDSGKDVSLGEDQSPHDIATLLKEYLRDLPEPLLCRDLYEAFVQTQKIRNRKLQFEALQQLIYLLPVPNRDTLFALLNFLATVSDHCEDEKTEFGEITKGNKMDSNNLATIFAPNILHCIKANSSPSTKHPEDQPEIRADVINVIRAMIDYNKKLFFVPANVLDEVYGIMLETDPELLDKILMKKEAIFGTNDKKDCLYESGNSTPRTPNAPFSFTDSLSDSTILYRSKEESNDDRSLRSSLNRKFWSREEFLHGTAATGGPDLAMKIRHKDREKAGFRLSKHRVRDDSIHRQSTFDDSSSPDQVKSRSSSIDSSQPSGFDADYKQKVTGSTNMESMDLRRKSSPMLNNSANIITASLKIPLQSNSSGALSLNIDDHDIPYIEDNAFTFTADGKQQMSIGMISTSNQTASRHRSTSGSDSSQSNVVQPITGSISLVGYDSAVGSSATFSSPPRNTSSISSSITGDGIYSSPPSWASTPPTSPDSSHTTVNYIPNDSSSVSGRITVPIKQSIVAKNEPITLQKVTISSISELQPKPKQVSISAPFKKEAPSTSGSKTGQISKSTSTPLVQPIIESRTEEHHAKFSPSISSIGGAVLKSKTADFERLLMRSSEVNNNNSNYSTGSGSSKKPQSTASPTSPTPPDKKKYVKRRYTDSRHETTELIDPALFSKPTSSGALVSMFSRSTLASRSSQVGVQSQPQSPGTIYKRREIIASTPKDSKKS